MSAIIAADTIRHGGGENGLAQPLRRERLFSTHNRLNVLVLFILAFSVLFVLQVRFGLNPFGVSGAPHYVYQAESFLHGRWDLTPPGSLWDTIRLHGKVYVAYPPFPALLLVPFVAWFGIHTSDILFTSLISALNLPLLYLLFEQVRINGLTRRTWQENSIISVLLYFGSINLWLSLGGDVWFTAHILCMTCALLSLLLAFRHSFGWSAALLGCAFFTRGTMALGFPLILYLAWQDAGTSPTFERFIVSLWQRKPVWPEVPWSRLMAPCLVCITVVALFLLRNVLVFGSPLESGYGIANRQNYPQITHGVYSLRYIPMNFIASFFDFPHITFASMADLHPTIDMLAGGMGICVFLTTPLFLLLFAKNQRISAIRVSLHVTVAVFVVEALLFCATGFYQFGARYLFDAYPFAFLLLALNERRVDWRFMLLGLIAFPINVLGAYQFWTGHLIHL